MLNKRRTLRSCRSNGSLPLLPFRRKAPAEGAPCSVIRRVPILVQLSFSPCPFLEEPAQAGNPLLIFQRPLTQRRRKASPEILRERTRGNDSDKGEWRKVGRLMEGSETAINPKRNMTATRTTATQQHKDTAGSRGV